MIELVPTTLYGSFGILLALTTGTMSLWLLYGARGMIDGSRNTETTTGRMGALFMAFITGCIILYVLWNFKILI